MLTISRWDAGTIYKIIPSFIRNPLKKRCQSSVVVLQVTSYKKFALIYSPMVKMVYL